MWAKLFFFFLNRTRDNLNNSGNSVLFILFKAMHTTNTDL